MPDWARRLLTWSCSDSVGVNARGYRCAVYGSSSGGQSVVSKVALMRDRFETVASSGDGKGSARLRNGVLGAMA